MLRVEPGGIYPKAKVFFVAMGPAANRECCSVAVPRIERGTRGL
jgi:hypothetical protein